MLGQYTSNKQLEIEMKISSFFLRYQNTKCVDINFTKCLQDQYGEISNTVERNHRKPKLIERKVVFMEYNSIFRYQFISGLYIRYNLSQNFSRIFCGN